MILDEGSPHAEPFVWSSMVGSKGGTIPLILKVGTKGGAIPLILKVGSKGGAIPLILEGAD